jgi:hypothetical protein
MINVDDRNANLQCTTIMTFDDLLDKAQQHLDSLPELFLQAY